MSTILSASDLNDFITPGLACVKPVQNARRDKDGPRIEVGDGAEQASTPVQINLSDCLACSGCITSSEVLLVESHSGAKLLEALKQTQKIFVASVCPQTRSSLGHAFDLPVDRVDRKLQHLFIERLGFMHVVGTEVGRLLVLDETVAEFADRRGDGSGPIVSSVCPGWTAYVEKTHPELVPYLSAVRSPQQVTGRLIKELICRNEMRSSSEVYHLSIMPCYDKKLESVRGSYQLDGHPEVDLVLTTRELVALVRDELGADFAALPEIAGAAPTPEHWPGDIEWQSNAGSSSGGYAQHVLASLQRSYAGSSITTRQGRNADVVEHELLASGGAVVLRCAQVYGFRNIQNIVRKLKRRAKGVSSSRQDDPSRWDYIELMACPGGCINGSGQIAPQTLGESKPWMAAVNTIYDALPKCEAAPRLADSLLRRMRISRDSAMLRTTFEPVAPAAASLPAAVALGSEW